MKIALFFGTFNPIHVGHLIIAQHIINENLAQQTWLVLSPHNPLKDKKSLLPDLQRLYMTRLAVEDNDRIKVSDIEFSMAQPNYTIHTLIALTEKYPQHSFSLVIGEDNLRNFSKWYNYEKIIENYSIIVFPRNLQSSETNIENKISQNHPNSSSIRFVKEFPLLDISSSFIRNQIKNKKDVRYLLSEKVLKFVSEMNFYK
ncbi:MAG: nicotinate-nucleotide adenylyltransferase [Flavobacteriia bacterium]|nr:nicotinate-nucleotide adenylyltransferase [Flavobacteriia bacterium]